MFPIGKTMTQHEEMVRTNMHEIGMPISQPIFFGE